MTELPSKKFNNIITWSKTKTVQQSSWNSRTSSGSLLKWEYKSLVNVDKIVISLLFTLPICRAVYTFSKMTLRLNQTLGFCCTMPHCAWVFYQVQHKARHINQFFVWHSSVRPDTVSGVVDSVKPQGSSPSQVRLGLTYESNCHATWQTMKYRRLEWHNTDLMYEVSLKWLYQHSRRPTMVQQIHPEIISINAISVHVQCCFVSEPKIMENRCILFLASQVWHIIELFPQQKCHELSLHQWTNSARAIR